MRIFYSLAVVGITLTVSACGTLELAGALGAPGFPDPCEGVVTMASQHPNSFKGYSRADLLCGKKVREAARTTAK